MGGDLFPGRRRSKASLRRLPMPIDQSDAALLHLLRAPPSRQTASMSARRPDPVPVDRSAFVGFCFPPEVIVLAVRWYLRFGLSYRDVEELLAERGVQVDHVTVYRWVLRFTPLLAEAARPCRHAVGGRWRVDETYVKVAGRWRYVYRAIDQFGQIVDVFVSTPECGGSPPFLRADDRRDQSHARRGGDRPSAGLPGRTGGGRASGMASHRPVRQQPGRGRPRPAQGAAATDARAQAGPQRQVIIVGHAFVQNLRRGHSELAVEQPVARRLAAAFDGLALAI
jgi:transposase InsO family protein